MTDHKFFIRPISSRDDSEVAALIRSVMTEHGASGQGFAIHDPEVAAMSQHYQEKNNHYFVVTEGTKVFGGGGFGPLVGMDGTVCEIRKMYFYPEMRGKGMGKKLLELCLRSAKEAGFKVCYLETLSNMESARKLYEKMGFQKLDKPMGNTGHFGCNHWYAKSL